MRPSQRSGGRFCYAPLGRVFRRVAFGDELGNAEHALRPSELVVLRFGMETDRAQHGVGADHAVDDFVGVLVRDRGGHLLAQADRNVGRRHERRKPHFA